MNLSIGTNHFLDSFRKIQEKDIDEKNKLNIFMININANEFDYKLLEENLRDPIISYAISRKVKEKYKDQAGTLVHKAKEKFIEYFQNDGELGELLLYCFLESHLKAAKILSKLELKTSNKKYVNGSDGVHYLKLPNGNYQLIFGESKMYTDLYEAIGEAFKSIKEFKDEVNSKGDEKSGITFEKGLISDNLNKEFEEDDEKFLMDLIYPKSSNEFDVDDAFGIFIGYQIDVTAEERKLSHSDFRDLIKNKIINEIDKMEKSIKTRIRNKQLEGHNFYIYVVPFTEIENKRKEILGEILN